MDEQPRQPHEPQDSLKSWSETIADDVLDHFMGFFFINLPDEPHPDLAAPAMPVMQGSDTMEMIKQICRPALLRCVAKWINLSCNEQNMMRGRDVAAIALASIDVMAAEVIGFYMRAYPALDWEGEYAALEIRCNYDLPLSMHKLDGPSPRQRIDEIAKEKGWRRGS